MAAMFVFVLLLFSFCLVLFSVSVVVCCDWLEMTSLFRYIIIGHLLQSSKHGQTKDLFCHGLSCLLGINQIEGDLFQSWSFAI